MTKGPKIKDLRGQQFGDLLVLQIDEGEKRHSATKWECLCRCGKRILVRSDSLKAGQESCGCKNKVKHGKSGTSIYWIWGNMMRRCHDPSNVAFHNYGGRGIQVCDSWKVFENFYADMGDPPPGMSLDRYPDKDGNYEPSNCRWATPKEQGRNTRANHLVNIDGETKTLAEWCEIYGQPYPRVLARINQYGWDPKVALSEKRLQRGKSREMLRHGSEA